MPAKREITPTKANDKVSKADVQSVLASKKKVVSKALKVAAENIVNSIK